MTAETGDRSSGFVTRRRDVLRMLAAVAAGSQIIPVGAQTAPAPRKGGVLRVTAGADPTSLDPMTAFSPGTDGPFLQAIYDPLIDYDFETMQPRPGLAEKWAFPTPTSLVLTLRSGVRFHDGTPLDAEAVKFNLERYLSDPRSRVKSELTSVEKVEVTGPLEVTLRLKYSDATLPLNLSDRVGLMVSPKAAQEGEKYARQPVGTGPWKFVRWVGNDNISVVRNENYWKANRPYLDGIDFKIITEASTGLRSVIAGESDFVYRNITPQLKVIADRSKNVVVTSAPTIQLRMVYFNYSPNKPLGDARVRLAFNYAIDRNAFNQVMMLGLSELAMTMLPSTHWAYDKELANFYPYDPDRAKSLMKQAGLESGVELDMYGWADQDSVRRNEMLMEQLRKVGFRCKMTVGTVADAANWFLVQRKGDAFLASGSGRPDAVTTYLQMFAADGPNNPARAPIPPQLPEVFKAAQQEDTMENRRKKIAQLQKTVAESALFAPIHFDRQIHVASERVKGFRWNLLGGRPRFDDVYLAS